MMDMQVEKLPKSALSYYVQLYCKKRKIKQNDNEKINLLAEATRSWLNLSASKKRVFLMKYNNCHLKLRKRFADRLRNSIPFPDQKNQINTTNESSLNASSEISPVEECQDINSNNQTLCLLNNLENNEADTSNNIQHQEDSSININQDLSKLYNDQTIPEPIPPAFRSTKDLYYIIKKNSDDIVPWENLSRAQKAPYITAACRIKRLYLMEYTNYLENLSNDDLLAHYNRKMKE